MVKLYAQNLQSGTKLKNMSSTGQLYISSEQDDSKIAKALLQGITYLHGCEFVNAKDRIFLLFLCV